MPAKLLLGFADLPSRVPSRVGRPGVPLSRDKGRSKCPGTNPSVPGRPGVIYQPHEDAGELLTHSFRIAPWGVASLHVNRGSDRKLRKSQNSISKQM